MDFFPVTIEGDQFLHGYQLIRNQYLAMLMKKVLSALRSWRLHLIVLAIPICMIIVTMLLNKAQKQPELPPLSLNLETYTKQKPMVLIENEDNSAYEEYFRKTSKVGSYKDVDNLTAEMLQLVSDTIVENPTNFVDKLKGFKSKRVDRQVRISTSKCRFSICL